MIQRRLFLQGGLATCAACVLAACSGGGGAVPQETSDATSTTTTAPEASPLSVAEWTDVLLVLHTNDVMGYVDPCG